MKIIYKFKLPDGRKARIVRLFALYYWIQVADSTGKRYLTVKDEGGYGSIGEITNAAQRIQHYGL